MSIAGVGNRSLLLTQSLVGMRSQLDDLQRQLATGKRADDYAGIGIERGLTVGLRAHLSAIDAYESTITTVGIRVKLADASLGRIGNLGNALKPVLAQTTSAEGRNTAQITARSSLGELLGILNTKADDRYLFSGTANDQPAVRPLQEVLDGDGSKAGFNQVVAERLQADLGASGLGRLAMTAPASTAVGLSEENPSTVFGFKLLGISTNIAGATVSGPANSPAQMSVDLGGVNPAPGDVVSFDLKLPDGSSASITLKATNAANPQAGEFSIGADAAATAANLQAKLTSELGRQVNTSLSAASALAAADNFFNTDATHPPLRVAGPPFATATSLVAGTADNTVQWYTGEAGSQSARSTATARIDQSTTIEYGLRANEDGLRQQVQTIAALAAISFDANDPDADGRAAALSTRLQSALGSAAGSTQSVDSIRAELAGAQTSLEAAKARHQQASTTATNLLEQVEGVSKEEVASKILALQTNLQASMQTTAKLYQLSLLNYL